MKRILCAVMILTLCLSLLPLQTPVHAEATTGLEGGLYYEIADGEVTITGYDSGTIAYDLVIPETIKGYPVTTIGSCAFELCWDIGTVTLPDTITTIGSYAFYWCEFLRRINIPSSVTSVGQSAFEDTSLVYNYYDNGLYLGNEDNPYHLLLRPITSVETTLVAHPDTKIVGGDDFNISKKLAKVTLNEGLLYIGDHAFYDCNAVTQINIPSTVIDIGSYAFCRCFGVTSLTVPEGVAELREYTFSNCTGLSKITLPESLTKIGKGAFYNCTGLNAVSLPGQVASIGETAFSGCSSLSGIIIPEGVTSIGNNAFKSCASLNSVYFCGNAPTFGSTPFYGDQATVYYHQGTTGWNSVPELGGNTKLVESKHLCLEYTYDQNYTCTTDGTERGVCIVCGEVDVRNVAGTAAHRIPFYTPNNDATCMADGTETGTCILCKETITRVIPNTVTDHEYSDYTPNNDATCTSGGTKSAVCIHCGDILTVDNDGALGHSFTNYISDNNSTCQIDGTETATCDRCDATDQRVEAGSAAHRYIDGVCLWCGQPEPGSGAASGDVTCDGKVNIMDVAKLYAHIKGTTTLTDRAALKVADQNADSKINIMDVALLYTRIKGATS